MNNSKIETIKQHAKTLKLCNLNENIDILLKDAELKDTGWIDTEYLPNTFDEIVIVYDYSLKVMNLLYDLVNISPREYNGYVYNTYSSLKTANDERNDYMYTALRAAYDNTNKLVEILKFIQKEGEKAEAIETEMSLSSNIFDQGYVDENSLYIRKKSEAKRNVDALKIDYSLVRAFDHN